MKLVPSPKADDSPKRVPFGIPNDDCDVANDLAGAFVERGAGLKDPKDEPKMLSLAFIFPDLVKRESAEFFDLEPSCELPKRVDGGGPIGVEEFALDGGAPAGVVETLLKKL